MNLFKSKTFKDILKTKKFWFVILLIIIPLVVVDSFFYSHAMFANRLMKEHGYSHSKANGIKHALAASQIYTTLKSAYFSDSYAMKTMDRLGSFNETMEQYIKWGQKDNTLEMMKDHYNNGVGIFTARWKQENRCHNNQDIQKLLISLANHNILANSRKQLPWADDPLHAPKGKPSTNNAFLWYHNRKKDIKALVFQYLDKSICQKES